MNWTGGSLQRTKKVNKGILQKQKAYFAQARTHLQNGTKPSAAPFRPSYSENDNRSGLVRHLQFCGSGPTRHDGHSVHRRHEQTLSVHMPDRQAACDDSRMTHVLEDDLSEPRLPVSAANSRGHDAAGMLCQMPLVASCRLKRKGRKGRSMGTGSFSNFKKQKRGFHDEDDGKDVLEANKKRLLEQADWTGIAPSRPLQLSFSNSRERNKIDRRRRVRGSRSELGRQKNRAGPATHQYYFDGGRRAGAFVKSGLMGHPKDIRIRIGTDALTNTSLGEPYGHDCSHASSDSMLFDQQTFYPQCPDTQEAMQPSAQGDDINRELTWNTEHTQPNPTPPLIRAAIANNRVESRNRGQQRGLCRVAKTSCTSEVSASEPSASEVQFTQYVEGVGQPFHLAFLRSISPAFHLGHFAVSKNENGGTNHAFEAVHASETRMGVTHYLGNKPALDCESEAAGADAIVDDQPWKLFFAIPEESSSHSRTRTDSEKSTVHPYPTIHHRRAESNSWSQHATQSDQTHVKSSFISASLPSVEWGADVRARMHDRRVHMRRRSMTTSNMLNEDERLWQEFVFGSNKESSTEMPDEQQDGSGQKRWKDSSSYLPLSVAVSSISATPIPGRAPRTNHGIHDAAMPAPPTGSLSIISPAATAGFVEVVSDQEQSDAATAELTAFCEPSVTHASLLNNASGDTRLNFPSTPGDTGPSRSGLEHEDYNRDSLSEVGAGQDLGRSFNFPESDYSDGGIDLVDVDRSS
jgi:hypothetical protein